MSFYKYTPALLEPKTLEDTLIGRDIELDNLKRILKGMSSGRSVSHPILIGPKGIGKTHILRILYHAVKGDIKTKELNTYKEKFIPVVFPEEEYYGNTIKFIMWTLRYLAESKPEGIPPIPEELIKPVTLDNKQKELALSYLQTFKKKTGKFLLLLVDNLNEIIERFTDEDQSSLREILMTYDSVLLIGSAPTLFDSIINHDRPLYNFFEVIWLKDLPFEESVTLLKRYAEIEGKDELIEKFKKSEPKLRAIHELAGGNPRLILSMYHIIVEGDITSVETTFLKLLDDLTPYFSLRMKDLSAQQSEIIDVMASAEKLLTPTEISTRCYMPVNIINSQLKRLEKIGYVNKSGKKRAKRVLYDLNEKLFRLWRQMRVEAGRRRLSFIVKFLEIWFTKKELFAYLDKTLCEIREKLSFDNIEIKYDMDKLWYIKEAIPKFRGDDEICVACRCEDYDAALKMIKKALNVKPDDTEMLHKGGCIYTKLKQYDEAIQAFKKAIELKPNKHEAWYSLGDTYTELKRYEEAIQAYKKVVELKPDMYSAWYSLGNVDAIYRKRYDEAIEAYKKAIDLKPDMYEAWYNLGNTYIKLKQYDEAIQAFKKVIELKPDKHEAWYNLGNTYIKLKQYDEAIQAYKRAIELKPDKHEAWNNLGNTYTELKRYEEAIRAIKKAIELKPDKHEAWYSLGYIYTTLDRFYEALEACKKSIEIRPDDNGAWYIKGQAYLGIKKFANALEAFKKAIKIKHCKHCEHGAWIGLGITYIFLFKDEGTKGHIDSSIKNLKESLNCLSSISEKDEIFDSYAETFKILIKAKKVDLIKIALNEIEVGNQNDLLEFLSPYSVFIKYLETKDSEIIERLHHEERIVVEDMIKMVEGENKEKSKQKKSTSRVNNRKKSK